MKSRKLCVIIFLMCIVFLSLISEPYSRNTGTVKTTKHFLWSVETERNTLYLLGSIHTLKKDSYPLAKAIEDIYHCCNRVVFETDIDGLNDPGFQTIMMKKGLYPPEQTLSQNISPQTSELLRKRLNKTGLKIEQFEQVRPWFMAQAVASAEILRLGFDPALGIDRYFFERAKRDNKEMFFLESNEYQINLFAGLGRRKQERLLNQILRDLDVVERNFPMMVDSWKTGDVDSLESFLKISFDEYPDIYRRLVTGRNKRWVSRLRQLAVDGDVLIIVGAAHLVGKDSLVEMLKKKGYKVKQM